MVPNDVINMNDLPNLSMLLLHYCSHPVERTKCNENSDFIIIIIIIIKKGW